MTTIYVTTQGSNIQRRSGQLLVCKSSQILQNVPETHLKQMVLMGNINLTTPVISFCLERNIEVVFLTQGGKYKGRLNSMASRSIELRKKQYERSFDPSFCLQQARAIVSGKIRNQLAFLRRQSTNLIVHQESETLRKMMLKSETAVSIESLLGIEGAASAAYFKVFGKCCESPWRFEKRTSNPPKDEINAILSLSYTLIYNRFTTALNLAGFDIFQGFFHQVRNGHAALSSDLMEEFRQPIADSLVLKLIRRKQLKFADFTRKNGEIRLSADAQKIFFSEFETKMDSKRQTDFQGGQSLSFANIIKHQVYHFARVINGEDSKYVPFVLK